MKEIIKLALRNLKEHKSKTIIISMFILFGVAIVIMGNSFLESVNRGLEKDFRANVTGDIAISTIPEKGTIIDVFGVNSTNFTGEIPQIPAINELEKVENILKETKGVKKTSKLISDQVILAKGTEIDLSAFMDNDDLTLMDIPISMLFVGEDGTFWDMFPDLKLVEGTFPAPGSNEIIVDTRVMAGFEKTYKETLKVGDTVLLESMGGVIREGKVVGIFKPANEYSAMFQSIYCEPVLARSFAELTYASSFAEDLPDEIDTSLSAFSEDDLFGDDFLGVEDEIDLTSTGTDFDAILGDTTLRDKLNETDDGAWHFILLKLENPAKTDEFVSMLEARFQAEGLQARACNWKEASGTFTSSVEGINILFVALVVILAVVVFIIIMNTMLISILERTGEIGTMRALGSDKKFVRKLFLTESLSITLFSAAAGSVLALILMAVFNAAGIKVTNDIAKMILGGGAVNLIPTFGSFFRTIIIVTLGSVMACFYPVSMALKITPLKALSQGDK